MYSTLPSAVEIVTPPASECITASEFKTHAQINWTDEDSLMTPFIKRARMAFEFHTSGRVVMQTTFKEWFPSWGWLKLFTPLRYVHPNQWALRLSRAKVSSVTNVKYYDADDVEQTLSGTSSDLVGIPAIVYYNPSGVTPTLSRTKPRPISVTYVAGSATANDVPEDIKEAIYLLAYHFYKNRSQTNEVDLKELPYGFQMICQQYSTGMGW